MRLPGFSAEWGGGRKHFQFLGTHALILRARVIWGSEGFLRGTALGPPGGRAVRPAREGTVAMQRLLWDTFVAVG